MKSVSLCSKCTSCPTVKVDEKEVKIGEKGNLCVLTIDEWELLRQKVLNSEL